MSQKELDNSIADLKNHQLEVQLIKDAQPAPAVGALVLQVLMNIVEQFLTLKFYRKFKIRKIQILTTSMTIY